MWSAFERSSRNIVKHLLEGTTHLLKKCSSTAACAHPFKRGCASFRRQPLSGQKTFTVLSLHISKKLILTRAVMLDEKVDLVAGDFNGAAWRCDNRNTISTIEEAFADCALPMPPSPTPLWRPGSIPGNWADVCGFLKPPESDRHWKVRLHGAFSIPHEALGLRPTDQSCHLEAWLHLDFVGWHDVQPQREEHDRRILLKERSSPYHYGKQKGHISDFMSDYSLSSRYRDHSRTSVGATYNEGHACVFTK